MLFSDPSERARAIQELDKADNVRNVATRFLTKKGEERSVMLTLSRLRAPDGTPLGTFGISKDVTEERRLQAELLKAERFAAIGQALAGIQHTMKNMLNALKGGSYMVRVGLGKDDRKLLEEGWEMVDEGISSLTGMTTHMLTYVRDWTPDVELVDTGSLLAEIGRVFRGRTEELGVRFDVDLPAAAPRIRCDAKLVHSAILDLLSNALDAVLEKDYDEGEEPAIALRIREDDRHAVVEVEDNGCGMTADVRRSVFVPFFSTKRKSGTGLGLALTARVIEVHGGEIEVETEPDVGSVFRLVLPHAGPKRV
jgi:signal transduction histidine kinase